MRRLIVGLLLCGVASVVCTNYYNPVTPPYGYRVDWYEDMPLDHFAFVTNVTFNMRYLINDSYFEPGGPIFFYCGNEGNIETFANNTGFIWDIASAFNALIIFAEHRFYGYTQPFGIYSYQSPEHLGYLSTEQVLADYAVFLRWYKANHTDAVDSPVVAFGGSYGGMLAAWIRIKYPHIVTGSLAASAPILQFTGVTPCSSYLNIVTETFKNSGSNCDACIKKSWTAIAYVAETDLDSLNEIFHLCNDSLLTSPSDAVTLAGWLQNIYGSLAEVDYPYPANFLNPVPGWPVKEACKFLTDPNADNYTLLTNIYQAASIFMNYTGQYSCYTFHGVNRALGVGALGWDFQSCTEMVMPMCANSSESMFPPEPWNFDEDVESCRAQFGVTPRRFWATTEYGGDRLQAASNIIFSNGKLDPWSGGGVVKAVPGADTLIPLYIDQAAHHYDIRGYNEMDTQQILDARNTEIDIIRSWIATSTTTSASISTSTSATTSASTSITKPEPGSLGYPLVLYCLSALIVFLAFV